MLASVDNIYYTFKYKLAPLTLKIFSLFLLSTVEVDCDRLSTITLAPLPAALIPEKVA